MKYLLLIYDDEQGWASVSEEDRAAIEQAYYGYTTEVREAGAFVAGEALQPTATATTVRVRNEETLLTDGPFAETKEQLGGFYMVECDTLDQALEWAAKIPAAKSGSIEVRPIQEFPAQDPA